MSEILNRTTLQLRSSVSTPDFSDTDWVINQYWKLLSEMSTGEKATVDAALLPAGKLAKIALIDKRTSELIAAGFSYGGLTFSLSREAQARLMGINQVRTHVAVTYPILWNCIDDTNILSLDDADELLAFYLTAMGAYRGHVDSGTALKTQVRDATTLAGVDAVTDTR